VLASSLVLSSVGVSSGEVPQTRKPVAASVTPIKDARAQLKNANIQPQAYEVTVNPQPIALEVLFQNPSGKGWWRGGEHATFKVKRANLDPTRKYNYLTLVALGSTFTQVLADVPEFSAEFTLIPVFNEEVAQLACNNVRPAYDPKNNPLYTWTATVNTQVTIQARFRDSTSERWETVATLPVVANATCEAETKPSH
jgi:hypothetical protein